MDNTSTLLSSISFIGIIEYILRVFAYISIIFASFKIVQAANIYINKNNH